jgi:hypothetical protein
MTVIPTHFLLTMFIRLYTFLLFAAQERANVWSRGEVVEAVVGLLTGLVLLFVIWRIARRLPWPRPFRLRFALTHVAAEVTLATVWFLVSKTLGALLLGQGIDLNFGRWTEMIVIGAFFYVLVAGVTYAMDTTARAARAEAVAARTQLAALRAQLHPHFLFNALHTVVQLIPTDPKRAAEAAELIADLLRAAVDEQRDEVTLDDEWRFVSRYLAVEQMRFGDRLVVRSEITPDLLDEHVPSFALQAETTARTGEGVRR